MLTLTIYLESSSTELSSVVCRLKTSQKSRVKTKK